MEPAGWRASASGLPDGARPLPSAAGLPDHVALGLAGPLGDGPEREASAADLVLPPEALAALLAALSRAERPEDVAAAALLPLVELDAVRAGAVVLLGRRDVQVLVSAGYPCGTFAPGARLPLDSGLPVTEAARTGRAVLQGRGPSWVAVPLHVAGRCVGALLLSLHGRLPDEPVLAALRRLAAALGPAIGRAQRTKGRDDELAVLEALLAPDPACGLPGCDVVVRTSPFGGRLGGDVVECVPDSGGGWLLVADVVGRGAQAAPVAHALRAAVQACAPGAHGPADVVRALERVVPRAAESLVTALVVRVDGDRALLCSAGHPPPLLVLDGAVEPVPVEPGLPLGTGLGSPGGPVVPLALAGGVLVVWSDGLLDRDDEVDLPALLGRCCGDDLDDLAGAVLAGCDDAGPAQDDLSLVLLRPR